MMIHSSMFLVLALMTGCSFAPQPTQICLTEDVNPINFFNEKFYNSNTVIIAEQPHKGWRQQFSYSVDTHNPSPEFFYAIAHADQIIAYIRPPFKNVIFSKIQSNLKSYGVTIPIELFVAEDGQKAKVVLECVKFTERS